MSKIRTPLFREYESDSWKSLGSSCNLKVGKLDYVFDSDDCIAN